MLKVFYYETDESHKPIYKKALNYSKRNIASGTNL